MKALVLGGNGFIGSHVVDALLKAGHKVRVFDRGAGLYRNTIPTVDYRIGSFSDVPALAEALEGVDAVFHLISTTVPSTSNLDPVGDVEGNLIGTVRLLQLMVQKGIRRIVYLSSGGTVYGVPEVLPIPESHSLRPICSYGVVKVAVENYLFMYQSLHGIQPVVLRASNPYGERQTRAGVQGVISTFMNKALNNERIEIWGDGSVVRDFIYIGDLAQMCLKAFESEVCGIFNVGSGTGQSINEVLGCVKAVAGREMVVNYKPSRGFDINRVVLDISKVALTFTWRPQVSIEDGVSATWKWLNENFGKTK